MTEVKKLKQKRSKKKCSISCLTRRVTLHNLFGTITLKAKGKSIIIVSSTAVKNFLLLQFNSSFVYQLPHSSTVTKSSV